ncbi:hypothetical protein D3C87_1945360 [compost metagenome]
MRNSFYFFDENGLFAEHIVEQAVELAPIFEISHPKYPDARPGRLTFPDNGFFEDVIFAL